MNSIDLRSCIDCLEDSFKKINNENEEKLKASLIDVVTHDRQKKETITELERQKKELEKRNEEEYQHGLKIKKIVIKTLYEFEIDADEDDDLKRENSYKRCHDFEEYKIEVMRRRYEKTIEYGVNSKPSSKSIPETADHIYDLITYYAKKTFIV